MNFSGFIFAAEDKNSHQERYEFLFQVADHLDQRGYTALWTPERHFQEFGGCFPNPSVLSAALAAKTQRLQLRAGSVVVPHHHPVRLAEEWALVDQISKGRTGMCLATGWHQRDFIFYPENFEQRKALTFDIVHQLRGLWGGESRTYPTAGQDVEVSIYPRPYQDQIPLWLVFSSDPSIWTTAGKLGLNVLALLNSWDIIGENIAHYRTAREEHGHDPDSGIVTLGLHTFVGEDNDSVRRVVEQPLKAYLSSFLLAKNDNKRLSAGQKPMTEDEKQMILEGAFVDLFDNRSLLGDVEKCVKVVKKLEDLGVNEVAGLIDFGVDFPRVLTALDYFDQVKARFDDQNKSGAVSSEKLSTDMSWYFNR